MKRLLFILLLFTLQLSLFTLQAFSAAPPAPVPKTGQTTIYQAGDDGSEHMGVAWPFPRFNDNHNGTVTDSLTGLVWLKNANCFGVITWLDGITVSNGLASGACGLSDASTAGQWRLPSIRELKSLVDRSRYAPALSLGQPFSTVKADVYWSSTTYAGHIDYAWFVTLVDGGTSYNPKTNKGYVWPVRTAK